MPVSKPPRRVASNWLLLICAWLLAGSVHAGEPTAAQRAAFKQAYAAAQRGAADTVQVFSLHVFLGSTSG